MTKTYHNSIVKFANSYKEQIKNVKNTYHNFIVKFATTQSLRKFYFEIPMQGHIK